ARLGGADRHGGADRQGVADRNGGARALVRRASGLLIEKAPLFALAAASSVITLVAQRQKEAIGTLEAYPLPARLVNALVSYAMYLLKTLWPSGLAVFYPYPRDP